MKYLCLVYADDGDTGNLDVAMSAPTQHYEACALLDFEDDLTRSGHALMFAAMQPAMTTTLQIRQGAIGIAETDPSTDRLIACFLIQARDLNEAIRVSGRMPGCRASRIEVQPVLERPPCAAC